MIDTQELVQGTDWSATIFVTDPANGPANLTGAATTFLVEVGGTIHVCSATVTDATGGLIDIDVTHAQTATMAPNAVGFGQVMATLSGGDVVEIMRFPVRTIDSLEVVP
jgi:hypothetical protein